MDMDLLAAKVSELAGFVWNGLLPVSYTHLRAHET